MFDQPRRSAPNRTTTRETDTGFTALRQFILKVHSRCDLACDYCYVYRSGDDRWRSRPRAMSRETIDHAATRIAEHVHAHSLSMVELLLHGGEPLLAGADLLAYCVARVREAVGPMVTVRTGIQTNGVRLDRSFLELFRDLDIRVGISVDGGREAHDRSRRDHRGRGSHDAVSRALRTLVEPRYRRQFAGLLCTVDLRNDPVEVYQNLLRFQPPVIDLLLPHGNWSTPPPGRDPDSTDSPYGRWLVAVFDRWYDAPRRETRVRVFEEVIRLLLGAPSRLEGLGLAPAASIVVETDGGIEESDHLVATSGIHPGDLNVARDSFDAALRLPAARARRAGPDALASTCQSCRMMSVCGGGLYSHRYRRGAGFGNPSVYCPDLIHLIGHVHRRLSRDVGALTGRPR